MTLSLVAASFFFLGHWLDLASGGGAQRTGWAPALDEAIPQDILSNPLQIEATVESEAGALPIDSTAIGSTVGVDSTTASSTVGVGTVGTAAASGGEAGGRSEL